jgi:glucan 1,3-beta-glucosidase
VDQGNLTVYNVQDFGATGNGSTDDTADIQKALNAVPAATPLIPSGAIVYFPRGNYLISQPLIRQQSNTRCVGEGINATTITLSA